MRSVTFQNILHGVARLLGMNPGRDLTSDRAATITEYINREFNQCWQHDWFPEWMASEPRFFRQSYVPGEFIAAGTQRYHIGSDAYYQALQEQAAATIAPATDGVENSTHWALLRVTYDVSNQTAGTSLAVGAQVRDPDTGKIYQVHTAHTTTSSTVDLTKCGELVQFRRTIALDQEGQTPIGTVRSVNLRDPFTYPRRPGRLTHRLTGEGIVVLPGQGTTTLATATTPSMVWVEFRLRPPVFTSTPWTARTEGNGYDLGDLVYDQGQVYRSLVGDNWQPLEGSSNWELVAFPAILENPVKLFAAASLATDQKQTDRATDLRTQAEEALMKVRDMEITATQEPETAEVASYGS